MTNYVNIKLIDMATAAGLNAEEIAEFVKYLIAFKHNDAYQEETARAALAGNKKEIAGWLTEWKYYM